LRDKAQKTKRALKVRQNQYMSNRPEGKNEKK